MKMQRVATLATLSLAGAAQAAGFAVDTHGARATGLATAVVAHVDDPSAIFYNPAGLLHTEEMQVVLGDTVIVPTLEFTSQKGSTTNKFSVSPPPHLYTTLRLSDDLAAGFGVFTAYGSSAKWPEDWEHRFRSLRSQLATYYLNPEVAYRITDNIRVGVGFQLVRSTLSIERYLNFIDSEGSVLLGGAGWGKGFNAGVQVDLIPGVMALGASYRSAVTIQYAGRVHFDNIPAEMTANIKDQTIKGSLKTPDTAFAGLSFRPMEGLLLAADVNYYRWSNVPEIAFEFEDSALSQKVPKRWQDTFNYHIGAEFQLSPTVAFRAGAVYDPTPSPVDTLTPDLPDSTRLKGSVGVGYTRGRMQFDAGYQIVMLRPVDSSAPGYEGRYTGRAHVLGLSFGYRP